MATNLLGLAGYIQQQGDIGRERGKTTRLADLMGQAFQAPREQRQPIFGQMAQVDPQSAFDAEKGFRDMDDNARAQLGQSLAAFDTLPDEQKAQAYPQIAQQARSMLGLPVPLEWNPAMAPNIQKLAQVLGGVGQGDNVQSRFVGEDGQVYALMRDGSLRGLGVKADRQMWFRDHPGMAPELVGKDGMVRPVGQPQATLGQPMPFTIGDDIPPEVAAQIRAQEEAAGGSFMGAPQSTPAALPPRMDYTGGGYARARPSEAQVAAEQEAAKQGVQLGFLPQVEQIKTDAAIATERGKQQAQADVELAGKSREKQTAYNQYVAAMNGVETSLKNTTTNPVAGRLPALTANQQIAEGAVAASAPVLKQLFRSAGEGVFTDKDQELLIAMLPTRKDHPAARKAKLENIDAIVRAKLGIAPAGGDSAPTNDIRSMSNDALLRALSQ